MKLHLSAVILTLTLSACGGGGGGGGGSGSGGGASQSQTSAAFVAPAQGEQRVFAETIAEVGGASSTHNVYEQITQVNADGSYTGRWSEDSYYLGGNGPYESDPYSYTYNTVGDVIGVTTIVDYCTNTFPSGGRPVSMQPGQTWDDSYVSKCQSGNGTSTTTVSGTYLGVESVSVPAGTYNAYKFETRQVVNSYTYVNTYWYDTSATDSRLVRELWQLQPNSTTSPNPQAVSYYDKQLASY